MQRAGLTIDLAVNVTANSSPAVPTGSSGILLSAFGYGNRVPDAINLSTRVQGTNPTALMALYTRNRDTGIWGAGGENGGLLNFGNAITASANFTIRDLAFADMIALIFSAVGGVSPRFDVAGTALINEDF